MHRPYVQAERESCLDGGMHTTTSDAYHHPNTKHVAETIPGSITPRYRVCKAVGDAQIREREHTTHLQYTTAGRWYWSTRRSASTGCATRIYFDTWQLRKCYAFPQPPLESYASGRGVSGRILRSSSRTWTCTSVISGTVDR